MFAKKSNFDPERFQSAEKLEADDNFIPCPANDGDELYPNGIFVFNITRILECISKYPNKFDCVEVNVIDFPGEFSSIDETHINSVDVSRPVIMAEISPGNYSLIDGNHRMEKARRMGIEKLSAYQLNVQHHLKFLTEKKAYLSYVEYWNSKCKTINLAARTNSLR